MFLWLWRSRNEWPLLLRLHRAAIGRRLLLASFSLETGSLLHRHPDNARNMITVIFLLEVWWYQVVPDCGI
jgi:hypothetical protein